MTLDPCGLTLCLGLAVLAARATARALQVDESPALAWAQTTMRLAAMDPEGRYLDDQIEVYAGKRAWFARFVWQETFTTLTRAELRAALVTYFHRRRTLEAAMADALPLTRTLGPFTVLSVGDMSPGEGEPEVPAVFLRGDAQIVAAAARAVYQHVQLVVPGLPSAVDAIPVAPPSPARPAVDPIKALLEEIDDALDGQLVSRPVDATEAIADVFYRHSAGGTVEVALFHRVAAKLYQLRNHR